MCPFEQESGWTIKASLNVVKGREICPLPGIVLQFLGFLARSPVTTPTEAFLL
jgi:hypothetical protein